MNYEIAENILKQLVSTKLEDLKNDLIKKAVRYARIRTDYQLAPSESRNEIGSLRTIAHNAFIDLGFVADIKFLFVRIFLGKGAYIMKKKY